MIITGIGSRKCPNEVLQFIRTLPLSGSIVRSGGAQGCDNAFEYTTENLEIFVPWNGFNENIMYATRESTISLSDLPKNKIETARDIIRDVHPFFNTLSRGAQLLHTRNVFQVLGSNLQEDEKSDMLICWTPDGANSLERCSRKTGGTATAIKLASILGISIYNIRNDKDLDEVCDIFRLW